MEEERRELTEESLAAVTGGMTRKEVIDCINNNWQIVPEAFREKLIDKFIACGPAPARKLLQAYIEKTQQDYLTPMLDLFR